MPPVKAALGAPPRPRRRPRRRTAPRGLRAAFQFTLPVGFAVVVIASGVWLAVSGEAARIGALVTAETLRFSAGAGLRVDHVLVTGRQRVTRAALERTLAVQSGMPILAFDPHAAKARIEELTWVRSAIVERRLPDTIYVRIAERRPLALWQHARRLSLIDSDGAVISRRGLSHYRRLPLVVGADAPQHAATVIDTLRAYPTLAARVHALVRVSGRRWDIRFENGVTARLPEDGVNRAMATLARLIERDRLFQRDVVIVDLRFEGRLVVRTRGRNTGSGGALEPKSPRGKENSEDT